jgi:hypothetical protein
MATFEGHVHGSKLSNLKAEVEKINKKAKKLGLEPMVIEVGERVLVLLLEAFTRVGGR